MSSYPEFPANIEHHYFEVCETFFHLVSQLNQDISQSLDHGELEEWVHSEGMELQRQLVQAYLNQRSAKEPRHEKQIGADGVARTHRRAECTRALETRFGEVSVPRMGYGGRGMDSVFPLDSALNLPRDKYSHGLRKAVAEAVIEHSFDGALAQLDQLGGGHIGKRQAEEVVVRLSQDFEAFYDQPLSPMPIGAEKKADDNLLVISADGKGIVMHPESLREATKAAAQAAKPKQETRLSPGEKRHRKRMATVLSVYEVEPHPRTAEQVLERQQTAQESPPRPKPQQKRTWAGVVKSQKDMVEEAFLEAIRRDPDQQMKWVVLIDGNEDLIRQVDVMARRYKVDVEVVQDFVHVLEYLWKAAHALHPDQPAERERWVGDRAKAVLEGQAREVAIGLRRAATRAQLRPKKREPVDKAAEYIEKNQSRLRYDHALAEGLPIATGVIEGACRHLVKDRMDITGARWGLDQAEAILKLRSLKVSGDLSAYWTFHFRREHERNHPTAPIPELLKEAA
jgi:hypothetical protein